MSVVSICAVPHAVPSWRIAKVDCRQPRAVVFITLLQLPFTINFTLSDCLHAASGRSLQEAPAQAPAAPADAIVSILDASGAATAAVPVLDASILKVGCFA